MRLSVHRAAAEGPDRIALMTEEASYTYRDLAQRIAEWRSEVGAVRRAAVVAHADVETVALVFALFEAETPVALLHPRLTPGERRPLIERVGADLVADGTAWERRVGADVPTGDAAAIFFTSGTTGAPKGVLLSERAFVAAAAASEENLGWQENDRWLLSMPIAHIGGFSILTRCFLARRTVILERRFDAARFAEVARSSEATITSLVPTMLHRLLEHGFERGALRAVLLGGAPASPELLMRARKLPILTTYGLTEACSQVTLDGAPLPRVEVRTEGGRIQIRGPTLFSGYLGERPRDPAGWFDTGDLGTLDGGRLAVHGRADDMILSGGENVHPAEVEAILAECPLVSAACVFGVPDPEWGEVVAAALVPDGPTRSEDELWAFVVDRLAGHKRPRRICWTDALVENRAGKIDRRAVRERSIPKLTRIG